ncbi:MAG TPA: hypothetical protein VHB20_15915 [Verrucomicrobiae bacterium]|jgi:anti-sigma factor RsiW|nr:hypothetical protein [Verrucomicrobiae bacterium]
MAIGALEEREADPLRTHLQRCAECRAYLKELESVTQCVQEAAAPEMAPAPFFHRRLRHSLLTERPRPLFAWRLVIPAIGMAVVLFLTSHQSRLTPPASVSQTLAVNEAAPTVWNYQRAAGQSPDALDSMLKAEAQRDFPGGPIYRAGTLPAD